MSQILALNSIYRNGSIDISDILPNLRDIAISTNNEKIKSGQIYRSARIFTNSITKLYNLFNNHLSINTIIDLREQQLSNYLGERNTRTILSKIFKYVDVIKRVNEVCNTTNTKYEWLKYNPIELKNAKLAYIKDKFKDDTIKLNIPIKTPPMSFIQSSLIRQTSIEKKLHESDNFKKCMLELQTAIPNLPESLAFDIIVTPYLFPIYESIIYKTTRMAYIVDLMVCIQAKRETMKVIKSSYYFPIIAAIHVVDKVTGTNWAPYYAAKLIISKKPLLSLYFGLIDFCKQNIEIALKLIAVSKPPILFHCSLGKDRTGVIAALVAYILGCSYDQISNDYGLTEKATPKYHKFVNDFITLQVGLNKEFCKSPPEIIYEIFEYIENKYGSADAYLNAINFTQDWRDYMKQKYIIS